VKGLHIQCIPENTDLEEADFLIIELKCGPKPREILFLAEHIDLHQRHAENAPPT
jgi:hypothetical protein